MQCTSWEVRPVSASSPFPAQRAGPGDKARTDPTCSFSLNCHFGPFHIGLFISQVIIVNIICEVVSMS